MIPVKKFLITLAAVLSALPAAKPESAQSSPSGKRNVASSETSSTVLHSQLNDLEQTVHSMREGLAYLQTSSRQVSEALAVAESWNPMDTPKALKAMLPALNDIRNPTDADLADPTHSGIFLTAAKVLTSYRFGDSSPPELMYWAAMVQRLTGNSIVAPVIEHIPPPTYFGKDYVPVVGVNLTNINQLAVRFSQGRAISRAEFESLLKAATDEATELPRAWESESSNLKQTITDYFKKISGAISAEVDARQRQINDQTKSMETIGSQIEVLVKEQAQDVNSVIGKLPWLVAILCGFFVLLIYVIRQYPQELQVEWVASGQVIQLLTVVTLLLIILCLAVSHLILENTIGTLLGGIGGYVLSQGVGRAAAREVNRSIQVTAAPTKPATPLGGSKPDQPLSSTEKT